MLLPWSDPYRVALALAKDNDFVLLESRPGFGSLGRRSLLASAPDRLVDGDLSDLDRLGSDALWAGWLSYDLGRQIESMPLDARDDRGLPPMALGRFQAWLEFDHSRGSIELRGDGPAARSLERAARTPAVSAARSIEPGSWDSSLPRADYERIVREAIDYIRAGDVFEVNLSQRLSTSWEGDPLALYGRVREIAPAPFMGLVRLAGVAVISASPELFLRRRGATIETRPIKGTRPRGSTAARDAQLASELRESAKDRAENVMIVDLSRNDLGRVCDYGTVRVPSMFALESHAGVHHLVSRVTGVLSRDASLAGIIRATFPPGSVTGAPKIRAMEIIEELEPVRRGVYCGGLAWIDPNGDFDMSVAIRTLLANGETLDLHVGGAVVAESDPHGEWRESMHKASSLLRAAGGQLVDSSQALVASR
jgi:para-aminobenzoate synthetase component 1